MTDFSIPLPNISLFSPNKFLVAIQRFPGLNFFAQTLTLPSVTVGQTLVSTNTYIDFFTPGDKVRFEDLTITFLLDEDLKAYQEIKQWIVEAASTELKDKRYSDMSVIALTNNSNKNKTIQYLNTFPYSISSIPLSTREDEDVPITVDVTFKYSEFNVLND